MTTPLITTGQERIIKEFSTYLYLPPALLGPILDLVNPAVTGHRFVTHYVLVG